MKKKRILGLALAAVMVAGSTGMVMADAAPQVQSGYSFNKAYQLTGGMTETAKSPAETFYFESDEETPQEGKASLYAVADTSYNSSTDIDKPTQLADLKQQGKDIPDTVKYVGIGNVSYKYGDAKNEGNYKPVSITVPDVANYQSVGYYYYKFTEKQGNTQGVTYSIDKDIVRVAVTNSNEGSQTNLKISDVQLLNSDLKSKTDNVVNDYSSGRLRIVKTVTGNMGDKNKEFTVKVTFNAEDGKMIKAPINVSTSNETLENPTEIQPAENGSAKMEATIKVKNGTIVEFTNVPAGVKYNITEEQASGYDKPQYRLNNEEAKEYEQGLGGNIAGGTEPNVTIVNKKDTTIDTGVFTSNLPYIIILAGAAAVLVLFFAGKKRTVKED